LLYSRDRGETLTVLCAVAVNAEIKDEEEDGALKYVRLGAFTPLIVTHDGHVLVGDIHGLWIDGWPRLQLETAR